MHRLCHCFSHLMNKKKEEKQEYSIWFKTTGEKNGENSFHSKMMNDLWKRNSFGMKGANKNNIHTKWGRKLNDVIAGALNGKLTKKSKVINTFSVTNIRHVFNIYKNCEMWIIIVMMMMMMPGECVSHARRHYQSLLRNIISLRVFFLFSFRSE